MKRFVIILTLIATPALAQQKPPPPYVPFTVEQGEFDKMAAYLMQQPMGVVEPVVQFLRQKETEAQRIEAAKQAKAKQEPPAKE